MISTGAQTGPAGSDPSHSVYVEARLTIVRGGDTYVANSYNWYFLSERGLVRERSHIAYGVNYELEDLLVEMTGGTLIAPENGRPFILARGVPGAGRAVGWTTGLCLGRYRRVELPPDLKGPRILFVTGMGSRSLRVLRAIKDWRKSFDLVVALVLDSFEPYPIDIAARLDHMFVIIPELAEKLRQMLGIPVSFMPLACDVLRNGAARIDRGIDVLMYGRHWEGYVQELDSYFLSDSNPRLYLTTFSHPRAPDWRQQRKQFWSVLSRSRISIGFAPDATQIRFQGLPVVSARWYEGLAAGCVMVGKRPEAPIFTELFYWPDSAIELPQDPKEAPKFIEDLLSQQERLSRAHLRNHLMMLRHHDARLAFARICRSLGLGIPQGAKQEMEKLERRVEQVAVLARQSGVADSSIGDQFVGPRASPGAGGGFGHADAHSSGAATNLRV